MIDLNKGGENQAARWNGPAGQAWVEAQTLIDQLFKPLEDILVEHVSTASGRRLLDVGCGTGGTTLAAARRLAADGQCVGVDVSEPMIAAAQTRAEPEGARVSFILADAQIHDFEPRSVDTIISRFGVMFFDDFVQAFSNLRRAAADGASLRFLAWRSAADNPFMTTAERAAAPLLPDLPARQPDAPGQFAFADQRRVYRILEQSGWTSIDLRPIDVDCALPETKLVDYFTRLGSVGPILQNADDLTRKRVIETVRPAFNPYVQGDEVRFTAACWMVAASAQRA